MDTRTEKLTEQIRELMNNYILSDIFEIEELEFQLEE